MKKKSSAFFSAQTVAATAVLAAMVVVLQLWGSTVKITPTTSLSLVLIPIVIGSILLGVRVGVILGTVFGAIVYFAGVSGSDYFTWVLFNDRPLFTALICFGKGIAAGVIPGMLYRLLEKKNKMLATVVAAASAPIVNTGIFILGALTMLSSTIEANFAGGNSVVYFLIVVCAGTNFLAELAVNLLATPVFTRVIDVVGKRIFKKKRTV